MAQFPILRLTHAGHELSGMSQGGGKLIFVRAELGDGQIGEGESVENLTALKHQVMQLPLQGYLNEGNGKARLRFVVENSSLTAGFFNREIGIFAKMEGGEEQLYAYTNAGNYADYIPSKDTPIDGEIIDLHIIIGNASNVTIVTENSAYATQADLKEHNENSDAHQDIRILIANAGIAILQRSKTYAVGDIAYSKHLPSWARLECVKAGMTGASIPNLAEVHKCGIMVTDGNAVWILDDVRDGARVGDIILRPTLRDGYIKANGATVKASEYPRLVAYVIAEHMSVTAEQYAQDCSKYVYDAAQDKLTLPNMTGRVLMGGESVKSVEAGLPNLKGKVLETYAGGFSFGKHDGPFYPEQTASFTGQLNILSGNSSSSVLFDASKSNPIYGAADTVQPPAIALIAQIKY
nr:MAG TPA: tail collar fiber protein [Bacteriophage sp.]